MTELSPIDRLDVLKPQRCQRGRRRRVVDGPHDGHEGPHGRSGGLGKRALANVSAGCMILGVGDNRRCARLRLCPWLDHHPGDRAPVAFHQSLGAGRAERKQGFYRSATALPVGAHQSVAGRCAAQAAYPGWQARDRGWMAGDRSQPLSPPPSPAPEVADTPQTTTSHYRGLGAGRFRSGGESS
jgi:hypothetical protein